MVLTCRNLTQHAVSPINLFGREDEIRLRFEPNRSVALEMKREGGIRILDI